MCTGSCKVPEISGKSCYVKPKHLISSLLTKRRVNRLSREPSIYLDAVLTNTIKSLKIKRPTKLKRLSRNYHASCEINSSFKKQKTELDTLSLTCEISFLKKQCFDYDEEIDDLCGMDSFFEKLKVVPKTDGRIENNKRAEKTTVCFDEDLEIQELVNNFIETGKL